MSDLFYTSEFQKAKMGDYGNDIIETATVVDAETEYRILNFLEETTVEYTDVFSGEVITETFPQGFKLLGRFKGLSVTNATGKVIAYLSGK